MGYFIIGDVHGCYHTYRKLLTEYWKPEEDILIQLGDLINKGPYSHEVLAYSLYLHHTYNDKYQQIIGNNDYFFIKKLEQIAAPNALLSALNKYHFLEENLLTWFQTWKYYIDFPHFFVSHAGIDKKNTYPPKPNDISIFTTREKLQNIDKMQIVGHHVMSAPYYQKEINTWYIDTGAGNGNMLTGIKLNKKGKLKKIISIAVKSKDLI